MNVKDTVLVCSLGAIFILGLTFARRPIVRPMAPAPLPVGTFVFAPHTKSVPGILAGVTITGKDAWLVVSHPHGPPSRLHATR